MVCILSAESHMKVHCANALHYLLVYVHVACDYVYVL